MGKTTRDGYYRRGGRGAWYTRDPVTGETVSTRCEELAAAKKWKKAREAIAADPRNAAAEAATLREWIVKILKYKETKQGRRPATLEVYRCKLGHFARIWGPDYPLMHIGPDACDTFVERRRGEGVKDLTIVKEFSALSQMLKLAKRKGCYLGDISVLRPGEVVPGYVPRERALPATEVAALLEACFPRLRALVARIVCFGLRLGEACRFRPEDLDQSIIVRDRQGVAVTFGLLTVRGTKTAGSKRQVPAFVAFKPAVLSTFEFGELGSYDNCRRDLARACIRAGIVRCTPNDLRRSFATLLIELGVDKDSVRRFLGHTTSKMVDLVYGKPRSEALAGLAGPKLAGLLIAKDHREPESSRLVSRLQPSADTRYTRATLALCSAFRDCLERRREAA